MRSIERSPVLWALAPGSFVLAIPTIWIVIGVATSAVIMGVSTWVGWVLVPAVLLAPLLIVVAPILALSAEVSPKSEFWVAVSPFLYVLTLIAVIALMNLLAVYIF